MSKFIQKSEVLNLRCINACQYGIRYLKYWSRGINSPLDPRGGQNFQCFIKSEGLLHLWGVYKRVQNIDFLNKIDLSTSIDPPRWSRPSHFIKHWKFWPPRGSRGLFMSWDQYFRQYLQYWHTFMHLRLRTSDFWMTFDIDFFPKVNRVRWLCYCVSGSNKS